MDSQKLTEILEAVKAGQLSSQEAARRLALLPYEDLGFAKLDHHRELRRGFPEVVLGQGKSPEQIAAIAQKLAAQSQRLLITKVDADCYELVRERLPDAVYHPDARAITLDRLKGVSLKPGVMVVSGGTADIPVAEEAAITAELMGSQVERSYDIGVAGIHRLLDNLPRLRQARVLVVVAGMEGALPSVVSGLVSAPVIAVPTSIGYGASFQGIAPLLAMLNSCAAGVAVVNIDNGFGAGYIAALINSLPVKE
ncbi:MAG TPA: nickel pincer cofactor biosynthesis protein LarB [Dehalococcoidia bacterium]|nr:nickel pincer cofactor biosynthesis protein LarB [Dehalococcoidia bacterium]